MDLYCSVKMGQFDASGNGTMTVTCGNFGPDNATGPVSLKFITPFFINVPTLPSTPGGTATWLYQNTAVDAPSMFKVSFAGIAAGASIDVVVPLALDPQAPNIPSSGRVIFTTDAGNTTDTDSDLTHNEWPVLSVRSTKNNPAPGNVNLYYTHQGSPLVIGGHAAPIAFHFYNGAGTSHPTQNFSHFTFSTPFYTRVPAAGRPAGFSVLYENDDPAIPSIYRLAVPPGVGLFGPEAPAVVYIPFQAQAGSPFGHIGGPGIFVPTGSDTQGDFSNSHHWMGFVMVSNGAI
ncbi:MULTISPECIES: hypothetical protein [unclassified Kitasatospora]|uniref:hypothetical protein n=1 Tax=unclassified Kitasatospora TaxID=2633591 RepID=UPI0034255B81